MRKTIAAGLPISVVSAFLCLLPAEKGIAAPIYPTLPTAAEAASVVQLIAATKGPWLNGYRGSATRQMGYRQNSDGYWYPARAFDTSREFTSSIMRPARVNDACNHGFTPTNGSSRCDY